MERKRVLRKVHIDIGDYNPSLGLTTCYQTPDPRFLVTLSDDVDSDPIMLVNLLAHEALHVASKILDCMQEDSPGEETMAYMTGNIASEIFEDYLVTRGEGLRRLRDGRD